MKYQYTSTTIFDQNNRLIKRPLVEIEIQEKGKTLKAFGLIDSGADSVIMNLEYAKHLNIPLDLSRPVKITGISGGVKCYPSKISFKVDGFEDLITVPTLFLDSESVNILLGQKGFFDEFRIKFEKDHDSFELSLSKKH